MAGITAYVGLPGSGKSYGVVENVILPAAKEGREVWANIPLNDEEFEKAGLPTPVYFDTDDIKKTENWFSEVLPPGVVIVLDEVWRLWAAGTAASRIDETHRAFLAEHRHLVGDDGYSTEIVLVTQDLSQVASFARNLVNTTYHAEKLSRVGSSKRYRIGVYHGPVTGPKPPASKRDNELYGKYKAEVFKFYKSHTKSKHGAGNESRVDTRDNTLKGGQIKLIGLSVVVLFFLAYWLLGAVYSEFLGDKETEVSDQVIDQEIEAGTIQKVVQEPEKAKSPLDGLKLAIIYNLGRYPNIDYKIQISDGSNQSVIDKEQLAMLGFEIQPISQCMVKLISQNTEQFVLCQGENNGISDPFGISDNIINL